MSKRSIACATVWIALALHPPSLATAQTLEAPPRPAGTASIAGRVVDGRTNAPVRSARVTLGGPHLYGLDSMVSVLVISDSAEQLGPLGRLTEIRTDAQGRFAFTDLPSGTYAITAESDQYTPGALGATGPGAPGRRLELASGQRASVRIAVWPYPEISGRLLDEAGEPLAGAEVKLLHWQLSFGRRRLAPSWSLRTNDRGEFHGAVPPGDYLLSARTDQTRPDAWTDPDQIRLLGVRRTFYPGGTSIDEAETLKLAPGDRRSGIEVRLQFEPMVRLAGQLRNAVGAGALPTRATLTPMDGLDDPRGIAVDRTGRFLVDRLFSGTYLLESTSSSQNVTPSAEPKLWVRTLVSVGDTDSEVTLDLRRGLLVRGRVEFDGRDAPGNDLLRRFKAFMLPPTRELSHVIPPPATVRPDRTFAFELTSGRYLASFSTCCSFDLDHEPSPDDVSALQQWTVRSAVVQGKDIIDSPLELTSDVSDLVVTFTRHSARLEGRVENDRGVSDPVLVVLVPSDESQWVDFGPARRLKAIRPSAGGRFTLAAPAGEYLVAAIRGVPEGEWRDADLFGLLAPQASRVSLREGETLQHDLRVVNLSPRQIVRRTSSAAAEASLDLVRATPAARLQQPAHTSAIVIGRVVAQGSGEPLRGVRVATNRMGLLAAFTDDEGRFVLQNVHQGRQTIYPSKPGWAPTSYRGSGGTRVMVSSPGDRIENVTVTMAPAVEISGTVVDHEGRPMAGAGVGVWPFVPIERRTSQPMPFELAQAITDERGQYRIGGLSAGRYILSAAAPDEDGPFDDIPVTTQEDLDRAAGRKPRPRDGQPSRPFVHAPMFYPHALDPARAEPLTLTAGDRRVVDFEMRRVALAEIAGVIRTSDGPSTDRISGTLDPIDPLFGSERTYVDAEPDGSFRVSGLLPGRYRLAVGANASEGARLKGGVAAVAEITLNELDQTLTLDLLPGATISGRVVGDSSAAAAGTPGLMVFARALFSPFESSVAHPAQVHVDGAFTLVNVLPGSYRLSLQRTGGAPLTVVSQTVDGRNTLDGGLDVGPGQQVTGVQVLTTTATAELSGIVRSSDGRPSMDADVVLFPADPSAWHPRSPRILATQTDRNGRYRFLNVPPGEYRIAAAPDMGTDEWRDPELLALLQRASTAVVLQAGRSATVDLSGP